MKGRISGIQLEILFSPAVSAKFSAEHHVLVYELKDKK